MTAALGTAQPASPDVTTRRVLARWGVLLLLTAALWYLLRRAAGDPVSLTATTAALSWLGALAAPLVAVATVLAVRRLVHERLPWPGLLLLGYLATGAWTVALGLIGGSSGGLGPTLTPRISRDIAPPLPAQLLDALDRLGADRMVTTVLLSLVGALVTPLVAVSARSLCGELSARRLVPILCLAPYALVMGGNVEAVAAAVGAGMLAVAVLASEQGRPAMLRVLLSVVCGLLLGLAALFGYSAILLASGTVCVFFVRRRPLLNVAAGLACLVPLLIAKRAGFDWTEGLATAVTRGTGDHRVTLGIATALMTMLILAGPALIASVHRLRTTPGWPFMVAGGGSLLVTIFAGLVSDRIAPGAWLPALPWLLVAAVAPVRQGGPPVRTPTLLTSVGAATAYVLALAVHQGF